MGNTVAHDSHNIIVVGTSDEYLCKVTNTIIKNKRGLCALNNEKTIIMELPISINEYSSCKRNSLTICKIKLFL
ncbi:adenine deaminase C-terminal domain-containing protein [Borreliella valaisiana]|uniref:adenine deaminase C-terminal domain-containing protein n=1 Tax=Borreliella valaisiana TaxID=62088 RepID=UPI0027380AFF|nr:adenine deaminase C-terminal domain-containing protein [Borreliella valaisiana]WLN25657.1 adenine deaminase C-terminal domain-containing protein [Borreliella valaisiana]